MCIDNIEAQVKVIVLVIPNSLPVAASACQCQWRLHWHSIQGHSLSARTQAASGTGNTFTTSGSAYSRVVEYGLVYPPFIRFDR